MNIEIPDKQPSAAGQASTATSPSRSITPNGSYHLKNTKTGNEHEGTLQNAAGNPEIKDSAESDNTVDINHEKLEPLEHRLPKRMYADRKNRLMEIYFSRFGSKAQHGRSREARKLAQRRRLLQDEKRKMD